MIVVLSHYGRIVRPHNGWLYVAWALSLVFAYAAGALE